MNRSLPIRTRPLSANCHCCCLSHATHLAAKQLFFCGVNHWQHSMCSSQAWGGSQMNRCGERQNRVELGKLWANERQALQRQVVMTMLLIQFLVIKAASGGFGLAESPIANETWKLWLFRWVAACNAGAECPCWLSGLWPCGGWIFVTSLIPCWCNFTVVHEDNRAVFVRICPPANQRWRTLDYLCILYSDGISPD